MRWSGANVTKRIASDAYMTPPKLAHAICQAMPYTGFKHILEPSCGVGNFLPAIRAKWPGASLTAVELDAERAQVSGAYCADALKLPSAAHFDLIIGNPPFSLASEFVEWSHGQLVDGGIVAFLLKLSFLSGKDRVENLYSKFPLCSLFPIVGRPPFRTETKATDSHEYGVFVWQKNYVGSALLGRHICWKEEH